MNYRFICAIHYFELERNETSISLPSGSISNERKMLVETFDNNLSIGTLGVHSIDEITEAPSYYIVEGAFENAKTKAACDAYGTQVTFAFLRQIQTFIGVFGCLGIIVRTLETDSYMCMIRTSLMGVHIRLRCRW